MSFEISRFENIPEIRKEGELESREKNIEPVTSEDMERWQELKTAEFRLIARGGGAPRESDMQKMQEIQRELNRIDVKRDAEKEKLVGPNFDREALLNDPERQREYLNFLGGWNQLNESEIFNILNRVEELKDMEPSTEKSKAKLMDNIAFQETLGKNYLRVVEEAKPLSEKEDRECQRLLQKYETEGLPSFSGKEVRKFGELQTKGQFEMEKLIGPNLASFEILSSPSLRKNYLAFIENWNNISPDERGKRLERAREISNRLERERQVLVGVGPAEPLPEARVFEKVRDLYIHKIKKEDRK